MRECGNCTLCCKVPRIQQLFKPPNQWCMFCDVGEGCAIYDRRPEVCQKFECLWLSGGMDYAYRPDKVGFYVVMEGEVAKVYVDGDRPLAAEGHKAVDDVREGAHVIVLVNNQITFLKGWNIPAPGKLLLEWAV